MSRLGLPRLFKREDAISRGAYNGYVLATMVALALLTALAELLGNAVLRDTMQQILIYGSMAVAYDYFTGFTGYYNLGFGAFTAIGAYTFVFLSIAGWPLPVCVILGGVASSLFGFLISYPFFRLKGGYFAIGTLSMILLLHTFFTNFYQYTGGTAGIILPYPTSPLAFPLMISSLLLLLLAIYVHLSIRQSRFGLALRSIKEDEEVTESFGVNTFRMKGLALALSAFFGGLAGALFSIYLGFISTDIVFSLNLDFLPLVASLLGGSGVFLGPLVGSFILSLADLNLPTFINRLFPSVTVGPLVVNGTILLVMGLFLPAGIVNASFLKRYSAARPDELILRRLRRTPPRNSLAPRSRSRSSGLPQ
ncbi:MAG: hypothetical protein AUJ07_04615 [Crenarchaeota archaeon 13_1_40CM_3_53_5]|nr:MAG: hypothetical protein AUJ07_04615 [Crenarchaeota archaeon 13_1_40CM_3_53_5]